MVQAAPPTGWDYLRRGLLTGVGQGLGTAAGGLIQAGVGHAASELGITGFLDRAAAKRELESLKKTSTKAKIIAIREYRKSLETGDPFTLNPYDLLIKAGINQELASRLKKDLLQKDLGRLEFNVGSAPGMLDFTTGKMLPATRNQLETAMINLLKEHKTPQGKNDFVDSRGNIIPGKKEEIIEYLNTYADFIEKHGKEPSPDDVMKIWRERQAAATKGLDLEKGKVTSQDITEGKILPQGQHLGAVKNVLNQWFGDTRRRPSPKAIRTKIDKLREGMTAGEWINTMIDKATKEAAQREKLLTAVPSLVDNKPFPYMNIIKILEKNGVFVYDKDDVKRENPDIDEKYFKMPLEELKEILEQYIE